MKDNCNTLTPKNKHSIKNILMIFLFTIVMISPLFSNGLFFSSAMASDNTTNVDNNTTTSSIDNTFLTITANQNTVSAGGQVTLVATVTDSSDSPTSLVGAISWNDGSGGGIFSSAFCNLAANTCTTSYTPSPDAPNSITITANYGGDATHQTSSGTLLLSVITIQHPTSVIIIPNSASFVPGNTITFTSTITDTSNSPTTPSGIVSWSDGNAGGLFTSSACTLSSGTCITSYTPSPDAPNSITITANYGGDATHQTSSGTSQLSQTQDTASVLVTLSPPATSSEGQVTVTAAINDMANSQNTPTGTIMWDDGNAGGIFSSTSCDLLSGTCNVTYTAPSNVQNSISITARYSGDDNHAANSGTSILTINPLSSTSVTVSPNPASYVIGNTLTFTATITDTVNSQNTPTGTIMWDDGNAGGIFSSTSCDLLSGTCTTSYTPPTNSLNDITITASYEGDSTHQTSSGTSDLTTSTIHATTLFVTPSSATISPSGSVTFTATVTDNFSSPITPTSFVSWSDGDAGGIFDQTSCMLSSGSCTVSYTPSQNPPNAITITASYNGDDIHQASIGSSQLSPNVLHPTTAAITPNPVIVSSGTQVVVTATIADTIDASSSMIGIVKWTDNGAGGSFSPDACIILNNHCSLEYTLPLNPSSSITITASYAGDSTHSGSSATSALSVNILSSTSQSSTTQPTPASQSPSVTQSSTSTQSNTSPSTDQSPSVTQSSTSTQSNTLPSTNQSSSTTQSNTPTQFNTESNTQSISKNSTQPSMDSNYTSQESPLATISQAISKVVSELETLFQKL